MSTKAAIQTDFLVIGSGIAGAFLALKLSALGEVTLVCKESLMESNTNYAQGGIAAVLSDDDSFQAHIEDTLVAGAGICHADVVQKIVNQGPQVIRELIALGVDFTHADAQHGGFEYHLTREGGHSARRVIHAADLTGAAVQKTLVQHLKANPRIRILESHMAVDLLVTDKIAPDFARNRCVGAYLLDCHSNTIFPVVSKGTFLATGGHGKLYLYTSNPDIATGDGIAMAYRAGARVANLEFMQFHPTCLYDPKAKNFLISEAVRGEGGILLTKSGRRLMEGVDDRLELAPRDIVARAIDSELKRSGEPCVYLDISHKGADFIKLHFPNIYQKCLDLGIDMTKGPIPVVPAAHYSCGGIVTDTRGRTGIKCLWALGEVGCTGLHGANRLASNSLLEGLVMAQFVKTDVSQVLMQLEQLPRPPVPEWHLGAACAPDEAVVINQLWDEIRRTMWNYVGIVRSDKRLARAESRIKTIVDEIESYYWDIFPSKDLLEVRNLATTALLTVRCARARKESRGIHYSLDYPDRDDHLFGKDTVLN